MSPGRPAFHLGAPVEGARQYTVSALVPTAMPKVPPFWASTARPLAPEAASLGGGGAFKVPVPAFSIPADPAPGPAMPGGPWVLLPVNPNCQITLPKGPSGFPD